MLSIKKVLLILLICTFSLTAAVSVINDSCSVSPDSFEIIGQKAFVESKKLKITACSPNIDSMMTFSEIKKYPNSDYFAKPIKYEIKENSNPFIAALYFAFARHKKITLSPDMIWLIICQQAAVHISLNPDQYRSLFTESDKKELLEIQVDELTKEMADTNWITAIGGLSGQLKTRMNKELYDLFTPTFSTTGNIETAAFQLTLMHSASNYYDFAVRTLCGIPEIRIEGTREDWEKLSHQLDMLSVVNLDWWIPSLKPLIAQFIAVFDGSADLSFWNSIVKSKGMSGGPFVVNGWIKDFFPYVLDEKGKYIKNPYLGKEDDREPEGDSVTWAELKEFNSRGLKIAAFSDGMQKTPFLWDYIGHTRQMVFYSGFIGVSFSNETDMIKPVIGYMVGRKLTTKAKVKREVW